MVEARRRAQAEEVQEKRRDKNAQEVVEWTARFNVRENESLRRQHEERLKKLSVSEAYSVVLLVDLCMFLGRTALV